MNLLMKNITNSNGCRHVQYPFGCTLPWTAEELTRFEALNLYCWSVIPCHLFLEHSANRPHEFVDERYSQLEWLPS